MRFFLGTHQPHWLSIAAVPLFVSHRSLARRDRLPRLIDGGVWALDSGGFTQLTMFGRWTFSARTYARVVRRYHEEIGPLAHAAPMDWMCEEAVRRRTGLTVAAHQQATVANFLELRALEPSLPWIPVLQGSDTADYLAHLDAYQHAGVDLRDEPLVGLGSVCRRGGTVPTAVLISRLTGYGLRLHTFGYKTTGLIASAAHIASCDSLAWSYAARRRPPLPGHRHVHCGNCLQFALGWRARMLTRVARFHPGVVDDLPGAFPGEEVS